jgi:hypothetical protein
LKPVFAIVDIEKTGIMDNLPVIRFCYFNQFINYGYFNMFLFWIVVILSELLSNLVYEESSGVLLLISGLFDAIDEFHAGNDLG